MVTFTFHLPHIKHLPLGSTPSLDECLKSNQFLILGYSLNKRQGTPLLASMVFANDARTLRFVPLVATSSSIDVNLPGTVSKFIHLDSCQQEGDLISQTSSIHTAGPDSLLISDSLQ